MIIDKATTCYVVVVLAACTAVVVVHDGYFRHPRPAAYTARAASTEGNSPALPMPSGPATPEAIPEKLQPPTLAVFSLPDAAEPDAAGPNAVEPDTADDSNAGGADAASGDHRVVRPFRVVRNRPCRGSDCAAWTATDLDTGRKSGAVVDLAPLNLAPAIASPARKGIVDLVIMAEALPDSDGGTSLHLRAIKLEGVAPHHLAVRAPPSGAHRSSRRAAGVVHASLPDWLAANGF